MDNEVLLEGSRDILTSVGLEYNADFSDASNQETYTKWDSVEGLEIIASFTYDEQTGEFLGVQIGLYSEDQQRVSEQFIPVTASEDFTALLNTLS